MTPERLLVLLLAAALLVVAMKMEWLDPNWKHELSNAVIAYIVLGFVAVCFSGAYALYYYYVKTPQPTDAAATATAIPTETVVIVPRLPLTVEVFPIRVDVMTKEELRALDVRVGLDDIRFGGQFRIESSLLKFSNQIERLPSGAGLTTVLDPRVRVNDGSVLAATMTVRAEYSRPSIVGRYFVKGVFQLVGDVKAPLMRRWDLVNPIERGRVE